MLKLDEFVLAFVPLLTSSLIHTRPHFFPFLHLLLPVMKIDDSSLVNEFIFKDYVGCSRKMRKFYGNISLLTLTGFDALLVK